MFGFKRKPKDEQSGIEKTEKFNFSEHINPDDDVSDIEIDWDIQLDMPLRQLAAMFYQNGWQIARPDMPAQPGVNQLAQIITELISTVDDKPDSYTASARLLALRDSDYPNNVDLYVYVGTAERLGVEEISV